MGSSHLQYPITAVKADGLPGFDYAVPQRLPSGRSGNHRSLGWFVAAGPGIPAGTRLPVQDILDLAPTALHYLGQEIPSSLHGTRLPLETAQA
jgi:hypothetical protein